MVNILIDNINIGQDTKVRISCRLISDGIEGNMVVTVSSDEYQEAFNNNAVNELVKLKFATIDEAAKKALNQQLIELTKENEKLSAELEETKEQQLEGNMTLMMMLADMENRLGQSNEVVNN